MASMMTCLTFIATYLVRIPVPATQGYIHLGDSMVFFSMFLIGWKWGGAAAGLGSALADLLGGFSIYAPVTFIVKFGMVLIAAKFIEAAIKTDASRAKFTTIEMIGIALSCIFSLAGYYVAEIFIYGNWVAPLIEIPMNILQFAVGVALALVLTSQIEKTSANRLFRYHIPSKKEKL